MTDLDKALDEKKSYWVELLKKYFVDNQVIAIEASPSIEEQERMATEEKQRIEMQIKNLGKEGMDQKEAELLNAIELNETPPPDSMLTSVAIPRITGINFHNIYRHRTDLDDKKYIDLSNTPIFTYFDHVKTEFVYVSSSRYFCNLKYY